MDLSAWMYPAYVVVAAAYELYLFRMQRSALEISRDNQIDEKTGRYMLPVWYASGYPAILAKWVLLVLIFLGTDIIISLI